MRITQSKYRANLGMWWLARTVFNPRFEITLRWQDIGSYSLDSLKQILIEQVDRDDDILTQCMSAKKLKKGISQASSFDELVGLLKKSGCSR